MKLSEMKEQSFPSYRWGEWKKVAEESLKGKPLEALQRTTYENIVLKPLYTSEDNKANSQYPGEEDFRRGINPLGYLTNNWKIAQCLSETNLQELKEKLKAAMESGQTALSFGVSKELIEADGFLKDLVGEYYRQYPFAVDAGGYQADVIKALEGIAQSQEDQVKVSGYVADDPLSEITLTGSLPDDFSSFLKEFSKSLYRANEKFPNLRTLLVNTTPYHNGGANAIQELGIAAATGVFYLDSLEALDAEQTMNNLIFKFSIGSNYFMEIAKLRAARVIWNKVAEAYGVNETSRAMSIAAETSMFTKTVFDPYVNLLRGGNEAFAAVIGGVQYLHVTPFDQLTGSNSFSERIARNIQLILQEEAHLTKVIDPAGGSWYIEQLTNELAQKGWQFFQEIEAVGGILEALKTNWLQTKIADVYEKRKQDIFTRKQSIVGTNVYANLADTATENTREVQNPSGNQKDELTIAITQIPQLRLSQPFEGLRKRADELKQKSGKVPCVGLICIGSLKEHKARLDFVRGFLSAGGVTVQASEPIHSVEEALEFVSKSETNHFCICGTNDLYQILGMEILQAIKVKLTEQNIYLAGLPAQDDQVKWTENGLKQFIHVKSNCFESLSSILSEMEVSVNEQIQA
ncbi:MAG: methylmalonyl-CoA mutase subunit beta [Bacillota bacterium]|nr:methylmalonyl-CoA mutase subunit beta [Bacillota bacterium]